MTGTTLDWLKKPGMKLSLTSNQQSKSFNTASGFSYVKYSTEHADEASSCYSPDGLWDSRLPVSSQDSPVLFIGNRLVASSPACPMGIYSHEPWSPMTHIQNQYGVCVNLKNCASIAHQFFVFIKFKLLTFISYYPDTLTAHCWPHFWLDCKRLSKLLAEDFKAYLSAKHTNVPACLPC